MSDRRVSWNGGKLKMVFAVEVREDQASGPLSEQGSGPEAALLDFASGSRYISEPEPGVRRP
jgi:hypothetical protein